MMWQKRFTREIAECPHTPNRRLPRSRTTTTELLPDPGYISGWNLIIDGLDSGLSISLDIRNLMTRFSVHEQITRLVCVEGWSAIAWWAGLRFDDLLRAYPPVSQAKWARVESSVNLDDAGNPDPYLCRSTWRRPAIRDTARNTLQRPAPYCGIMEHHSAYWFQ